METTPKYIRIPTGMRWRKGAKLGLSETSLVDDDADCSTVSSVSFGLKAIAKSLSCDDMSVVRLHLAAQTGDVYVHRAVEYDNIMRPNLVDKLLTTQYFSFVFE